MNLTEEQLRIVQHDGGHARVSAVAGSGKTTTMVARVGQLLAQDVAADSILVLMFNKSARNSFAESMEKRLSSVSSALPEVRTFHSLGMRLVNSFTKRGALPRYKLVTEEYLLEKLAQQVANEVYREELNRSGWLAGDEVEEFIAFIDRVKSTVSGPADVFKSLKLSSRYSYFIKAYNVFEKVRKERKIRFYADLIYDPIMAMLESDELASWVANRVEHIIVDEYQDVNECQQQLLKILAGKRAKVMVVGDEKQCIYKWRGAQPEFITTRFQEDFSNPKEYLLSYTFRYGHQLSLAANHLISGNHSRDSKLCISHPSNNDTVVSCVEESTVHPVVSIIARWQEQGRFLGEAVVLVRLFAMSVSVELALLEAGVPYRVEGNSQVFDCSEVLALTGYLNLVAGRLWELEPEARLSMISAMLSQPHLGIKQAEMGELVQQIGNAPDKAPDILMAWSKSDFPPFIRKKIEEAAIHWRWLSTCSDAGPANLLLNRIVDKLKLYEFYHNFCTRSVAAENRVKTCQAFIAFAASQTLSIGELLIKIEEFQALRENPTSDSLLITSIHRAKGLEWPLVVLPGLEEGIFPFFKEGDTGIDELEDERRLFYVGMTRAIEQLVCVHPVDAELKRCMTKCFGKIPRQTVLASRFLYESNFGLSISLGKMIFKKDLSRTLKADDTTIARQYLNSVGLKVDMEETQSKVEEVEKISDKVLGIGDISEGLQVWHQSFGEGTVTAIKDRKQGRIEVLFQEHGAMVLLVAYAKIFAF